MEYKSGTDSHLSCNGSSHFNVLLTKCNKFVAGIHHLGANLGWHYEVTTDIDSEGSKSKTNPSTHTTVNCMQSRQDEWWDCFTFFLPQISNPSRCVNCYI